MANQSTSSSSFVNLRWQVNSDVRLSMSHWTREGVTTFAVALLRKHGETWAVDHDSAAEIVRADEEDGQYRSTNYGAKLVAQVLGECPLRFFRDSFLP